MAELRPDTRDALDELQEILRGVCISGAQHRLSAVRYVHCRSALLNSELRSALPGFLTQCVSINKFHDFISLYDPRAENRISFVDASFANCRTRIEAKRVYDVFDDDSDF